MSLPSASTKRARSSVGLGTKLAWPYISARPLRGVRGRPKVAISSMARATSFELRTLTM